MHMLLPSLDVAQDAAKLATKQVAARLGCTHLLHSAVRTGILHLTSFL